MPYRSFAYTLEDHIAHIRFNRPEKRNCMTLEFWSEIGRVFHEIDATAEARVAVITAEGPHFTAGIDLELFASFMVPETGVEEARRRERMRRQVKWMQERFQAIQRLRVPVLAAVQGGCIGGGLDMVTACDMLYATRDAYFVVREIFLGMTADLGTLQRLPRTMPRSLARELAFTGRQLPADEALAAGFINAVYDDVDAMQEAVFEIARTIAGHSPLVITGTKEMLNYTEDHTLDDGLNYIATWNTGLLFGDDTMEAYRARVEEREPVYQDLLPGLGPLTTEPDD